MPSIDNLRKQAKRIVRWHRERHYPVSETIRTNLPHFGSMSDIEILEHSFQLSDALELVARQQGFPSWQALLEGANNMSEYQSNPTAPIAFKRSEPQIFVTQMHRAMVFYTDNLGFEKQFSFGEPPFYAQVARGDAFLNLRLVAKPIFDPNIVREEELLAATICVESIKELFLEYQSSGIEFHQNLRTEPWGARTFIVADPDGNMIQFAE